MADILEYKCPSCGGAIGFDSASQQMVCPFCDTQFEMEALRAWDEALKNEKPSQMDWQSAPGSVWAEGEQNGMQVYGCKSCGGQIIADQSTAATKCPYCDNPVVVTGQFSGSLRPNMVIPFQLDKKAAKAALKKHLTGKRLLPKVFRDENHIDEIKGIYVPFWLFDTQANADIRYKGTRSRSWSDKDYNYVETSHFAIHRAGTLAFDRVPVDGSSKMADDLMESIEPFDFRAAVDFQTAYLAGYLADKYDVDAQQSMERANSRITRSTEEAFAATVTGFAGVTPEHSSIQLANARVNYALLPVWILNTSWKGSKYTFAMNGQTGKFVGDLPLDKSAYWRWFGIVAAIGSAAAFGIQWLMR